MTQKNKSLEKRIAVYQPNDRTSGYMTDPLGIFSLKGTLSLADARGLTQYLEMGNGLNRFRTHYVPQLIEISQSGDEKHARIAKAFLEVFEVPYNSDTKRLTEDQKSEIRKEFNHWNSRGDAYLTTGQEKLFKSLGISYKYVGHPIHIELKFGRKITSLDTTIPKYVASHIIHLVEKETIAAHTRQR